MNRAYSIIEAKGFDGEKRTFSGWATTPTTDRANDTIDPMGAKFTNPLVLLHQHRHDAPIGTVKFGKPTAKGIEFEAEIPAVDEPGPLKDRVDTAWGEIRHGLIRAVSIGFRPLKYAFRDDGGIDYQEVEIYELSIVSIPTNSDAVISAVKSLDRQARDAAGVVDDPLPEIPLPLEPAASGNKGHVVKLNEPVRDRTKTPFVLKSNFRPD